MAKLDLIGEYLLDIRIKEVIGHVNGRLLDIGCGTNKLVRTYGNGVGVDVFQFGNADMIVSDTGKLPLPDSGFDTITIIASLNHIPNRSEVLGECRRLLKDDGRLIITMIPPAISRIWHLIRSPWDRDQQERGMIKGEVYGLDRQDMAELLDLSGFKICQVKKFMLGINSIYIAAKQDGK